MDGIDIFTKQITHSKENGEQITLEVEELQAVKEESGVSETDAFREAVKEIFEKWKT